MNERIEKLVEQAGIWKPTHDHKTWVRGEYVASPGELEKFAELIVRECVHTVENRGGMCGALSSNWIKEHFGVE